MSDLHACLLGAFFILQILDIYTTYTVLKQGPGYREANPALAPLMQRFGILPVLIPVKLVAFCIMAWLASFDDPLSTSIIGAACALYLVVVCHNYDNIE